MRNEFKISRVIKSRKSMEQDITAIDHDGQGIYKEHGKDAERDGGGAKQVRG